ncbi:MAG: hypothetical protein K2N35_17080, partial [Muribaculaceae bacterium]|nr:hypothetical protein [Muribaculaceae bacterium]
MKQNLTYQVRLMTFAITLMVTPLCVFAESVIELNGVSYPLTKNTVVLDREGLLDCSESYRDPAEAFEKINKIGNNAVLLVAPSVYWLDNPDDPSVRTAKGGTPYAVHLNCDTLAIIGLSAHPEDIVFAVNRGQSPAAGGNFTMLHF